VTLDWVELREFLPPASQVEWSDEVAPFCAGVQLCRRARTGATGAGEIMQDHVFGPLRLRSLNA
jgi:segregation and condensation protein A